MFNSPETERLMELMNTEVGSPEEGGVYKIGYLILFFLVFPTVMTIISSNKPNKEKPGVQHPAYNFFAMFVALGMIITFFIIGN